MFLGDEKQLKYMCELRNFYQGFVIKCVCWCAFVW